MKEMEILVRFQCGCVGTHPVGLAGLVQPGGRALGTTRVIIPCQEHALDCGCLGLTFARSLWGDPRRLPFSPLGDDEAKEVTSAIRSLLEDGRKFRELRKLLG